MIFNYFKNWKKYIRDSIQRSELTLNVLDVKVSQLNDKLESLENVDRYKHLIDGFIQHNGLAINGLDIKINKLNDKLESLANVDGYKHLIDEIHKLVCRVEFIREELMFELRIKTGMFKDKSESIHTISKVINSEKFNAGLRSINIGCGHIQPNGYINVDMRELPGIDVIASAVELPFDDLSIDEIYCAHLVEHFTELELIKIVLPHWFQKIRRGGKLRVIVPDADSMINDYIQGSMNFVDLNKVTFGAQDYDGDFHYIMFSVNSLTQLLLDAGFSGIEVIENNRKNGLCREMELVAYKN